MTQFESYLHDLFADDDDFVVASLEKFVEFGDAVLETLFQIGRRLLGVLKVDHLVSVCEFMND